MRCRNSINKNIVWFKSYGIEEDGKAKKVDENFVENEKAVAQSLKQKLSVIQGELWYHINYGLPLYNKVKSKGVLDAVILGILEDHPSVKKIINFKSSIVNHKYTFTFTVNTIYNKEIILEDSKTI